MADERSLSELFWDYGVYAPIGLAAAIVDELPRLSDKGKARAANQIQVARLIGKMAVGQGRRHFGKLFGEQSPPAAAHQATSTAPSAHATRPGSSHTGSNRQGGVSTNGRADLAGDGTHAPPAPRQPATRPAARTAAAPVTRPTSTAKAATGAAKAAASSAKSSRQAASGAKAPSRMAAGAAVAPPAAASLAIPGYDTLAASQVVQRLSSLRPEELEAIRRYELSTRGRRTILHRIAQLAADR